MRGQRGRGRGRGRGAGKSTAPESELLPQGQEPLDEDVQDMSEKRGRGRPAAGGASGTSAATPSGGVSRTVMQKLTKSLPRDDKDGQKVVCSECKSVSTYRQFRLHNIQDHLNTAATEDEREGGLVMDHKYFARKLNEFKRLTKATVFTCPRNKCESSFKSTLGLAYHMNTCGRSKEELDAVLMECEICKGKFTLPNMGWHRKTHQQRVPVNHDSDDGSSTVKQILSGKSNKRRSAIKARKSFKKMADGETSQSQMDDDEWEDTESQPEGSRISTPRDRHNELTQTNDYCSLALKFLEGLDTETKAWDEPTRNCEDPFITMKDNKFHPPSDSNDTAQNYLPDHRESVEFKYVNDEGTSKYHKLTWFEGETLMLDCPESPSLHYTGGPVLSMSWHPSGKLLAVSVGKNYNEEIDLLKTQTRKSSILIYSSSAYYMSLQLVIGIQWGYATQIQWSSFCPDIMDSYDPSVKSCFDDVEIFCRIGYLAMTCEDSTVRIMAVRIEDLKLVPNFEYKHGHRINVYTKIPEICLKLDESVIDDDLGQAVKFDWHEQNKFFAVGYVNGVIALYDLQSTCSPLLVQTMVEGDNTIQVINPFWVFPGHRLSIRGIKFDPMNPRYLVTAGQDRSMKVWDVLTRMERDAKRVGITMDMCWIRGWMHQMTSFETHVSFQSSMYNYVRAFQVGCSTGRATYGEVFNVTSLDFYHGLTVQGTDDGSISITYYDMFWRECDFDRNRKKKNLVHLCTTGVDKSSYNQLSSSDFTVTLKKLSKSVCASKLYRSSIDEEEGIYAISLEAKFGDIDIYDPILESDNDSDEEGEDEEMISIDNPPDRKLFTVVDGVVDGTEGKNKPGSSKNKDPKKMLQEELVMDAINMVHPAKVKDGLLPVFDVNIPDVVPKLIFCFVKQRPNSSVPTDTMSTDKFEEYVRFHSFLRINKVTWSPNGKVIAVGYRNGLISLIPGSFDNIFAS